TLPLKMINMKKTIKNPLFRFCIISLFLVGCGNVESHKKSTVANNDSILSISAPMIEYDTSMDFIPIDLEPYAKRLEDEQTSCATTPDTCGNVICDISGNYCNSSDCIAKIKCCHKILKPQFDSLTKNGSLGHAAFMPLQIRSLVDSANCY